MMTKGIVHINISLVIFVTLLPSYAFGAKYISFSSISDLNISGNSSVSSGDEVGEGSSI